MKNEYTAAGIMAYIVDLELKNKQLEDEINELERKAINADKFDKVKLNVPTVAVLQGVDPRTVRAYVLDGAIPKHPDSTDSRTYIRGSVALQIDFSALRKKV